MIGIVITAYNRCDSLKNLLKSLSKIEWHPEIKELPLVISIDNGGTPEVNSIAEAFDWKYGTKEVIIHPEKKGLVKHFIWAGDQTERFDQVIFLEDDLYVSPQLLFFVKPMIEFYKDIDEVAAASLYNPVLLEATGTKFYQVEDGYDTYFVQHPYWGNVWFKDKWNEFKEFLKSYTVPDNDILPPNIASWNRSFKKIYTQFLIKNNKTVIFPRVSLVSNNGDAGIHSGDLFEYQSNIQLGIRDYIFARPERSKAKYDAFFEINPEIIKSFNGNLSTYDFETDLNGLHNNYSKEYVLTTKPCKNPILSFTSLMKPAELGVMLNEIGNSGISLCKPEDIDVNLKKYYRNRRFKDIRKNYHIGIIASIQISKHLWIEGFRILRDFLKRK